MSYISISKKDKEEMRAKIGVSCIDELFSSIPENVKRKKPLNLPHPLSELELKRYFEEKANNNQYSEYLSFLGGGAYNHFIPAVVDYLSQRGEFLTPYTPYQPEVSQGTLQVIFEFQTLICQLTGMDVANASLYDGASGAAEAVLMAHRLKGKSKILVARTLHPQYREVIKTYTKDLGLTIEEIGYLESGKLDFNDLRRKFDEETFAVICQSPNFVGVVEELETISKFAHDRQVLSLAVVAEPVSLGMIEPPGKFGVDIVAGEGQSFGIPLGFGGPYLGFMACGRNFVRQFPGRIVGQTKDGEGNRGFVLTLCTREQHIRRGKATSNICTNQNLCALRATIFLETTGKKGLKELAFQNLQKSHYALEKFCKIKGIKRKFEGPFFNEFTLQFSKPWSEIDKSLRKKKMIGGLGLEILYPELKNCALFCITEMHRKEDIDKLAAGLEEATS